MARYFFDRENGSRIEDEEGLDIPRPEFVPARAVRMLLHMATSDATGSDRRFLSVTVRNGGGKAVYRAALTVNGGWLGD